MTLQLENIFLNNKEYDSISDAINDTENTQEAIENKRKEEVSQQGNWNRKLYA